MPCWGELAARQLAKRGVKQLLVLDALVSGPSARRVLAGHEITPDQLDDALARSDAVISATGAPRPVLRRDQLQRAVARRGADAGPPLVLDLSVPRDVDSAANGLSGIHVHTIDDLRDRAERTLVQRRAELPDAYAMLDSEVARFTDRMRRRETVARRPGLFEDASSRRLSDHPLPAR